MLNIIIAIVIALWIVVFGPALTIWALNTLFGLSITLTLKTWFAAMWLGMLVYGASSSGRK